MNVKIALNLCGDIPEKNFPVECKSEEARLAYIKDYFSKSEDVPNNVTVTDCVVTCMSEALQEKTES